MYLLFVYCKTRTVQKVFVTFTTRIMIKDETVVQKVKVNEFVPVRVNFM